MDVYYSSIARMDGLDGMELLSEERRVRVSKYLQLADKKRCLLSGLLLRAALGENNVRHIRKGPYGKPFLPRSALPNAPCFNISHSGDLVVLCTANCEVGIDVEHIGMFHAEVAKKCFTPREQAWIEAQANRTQAFYTLWTGKESIMKASGRGFTLEPETFCVLPVMRGAHYAAGGTWFLAWRRIGSHMICTASAAQQELKLHEVAPKTFATGEIFQR